MYPDLLKLIPEGKAGDVKVSKVTVTKTDSIRSAMSFDPGLMYCSPGDYLRLSIGGRCVMSNTRMEQNTNLDFVLKATGRVLIAGLGLGMIIIPTLQKPEVESVTVVEINSNVIKLVYPYIKHPKLHVIQADIYQWLPKRGTKFDTIYFDIWNGICEDNLPDMRKLSLRFRPYFNSKNPNRYINSWSRDWLRYEIRREKANS